MKARTQDKRFEDDDTVQIAGVDESLFDES